MMKIITKIDDSTSLKLKELMKAVEGTCSFEEKMQARKIFRIYLDTADCLIDGNFYLIN